MSDREKIAKEIESKLFWKFNQNKLQSAINCSPLEVADWHISEQRKLLEDIVKNGDLELDNGHRARDYINNKLKELNNE